MTQHGKALTGIFPAISLAKPAKEQQMNPKFFFYKMKEVKSFLQIMRGKIKGDSRETLKGVDNALKNMQDEKKLYQKEREKALKSEGKDKVQRESGQDNQRDISAI